MASLAGDEDGVLTTAELHACGFDKDSIALWTRQGRMRSKYRGVHVIGPIDGLCTDARAALKACGEAATAGFHLAAQLDGFGPPAITPLDVIVPPNHRGRRPGLRLHRITLAGDEVRLRHGLRTTTTELTCIHLASIMPPDRFEWLLQEAFAKRKTNTKKLEAALERHRGARGTRRLARMLEIGVEDLRSKAERELKRLLAAARLGPLAYNEKLGRWTVDVHFPQHGLVIEVNGFAGHSSPWAHDRDHRKQQDLEALGLIVRRFTALQVLDEPEWTLARIARDLGALSVRAA